jgi:hypothetical protein
MGPESKKEMSMKNTSKTLLFGALVLSLVASAFALQPGLAASGEERAARQDVTPTATAAVNQGSGGNSGAPVVEGTPSAPRVLLWDQFCVKKIPYTLLAVSESATFEVNTGGDGEENRTVMPTFEPGASNPNKIACTSAGVYSGRQLIVCTGPNNWSFDITISDGGESGEFPVPLKWCPIKDPVNYRSTEAPE